MTLFHLERTSSAGSPALYRGPTARHAQRFDEATDCEFIELLGRYRDSGGLANVAEVQAMAVARRRAVPLHLAIDAQGVIAFGWQQTTWLPLFQFSRVDLSVKPGVAAVLAELAPVFDRVTLARWFVQANCSLRGQAPVQALEVDAEAVADAARIDRFVAAG